jgi:hypothetical protein
LDQVCSAHAAIIRLRVRDRERYGDARFHVLSLSPGGGAAWRFKHNHHSPIAAARKAAFQEAETAPLISEI